MSLSPWNRLCNGAHLLKGHVNDKATTAAVDQDAADPNQAVLDVPGQDLGGALVRLKLWTGQ